MTSANTMPARCRDALENTLRPELFKALCDPVRISIVANLAAREDESSVSDIAECCGIDFSGVSRHLKILRDAGVLSATREGRHVYYALDCAELATSLRGMADALDACCVQT